MKKLLITLGVLLPALCTAQALKYGNTVTIGAPVYEDLYAAGSRITVNAPIHGDMLAAGAYITINDSISNDIQIAGGEVTVNGYAGDDIRGVAGRLYIQRQVAGDLVITGGNVLIARTAVITGNVIISGGSLTMDGSVKGNVKAAGGTVRINGTVEKALDCRGEDIAVNGLVKGPAVLAAQTIDIGDRAAFMNGVRYWKKRGTIDFGSSIRGGKAVIDKTLEMEAPRWHYLGFASFMVFVWYLGPVFVFILLIQYLFGSTMQKAGSALTHHVARSVGYGLLFLIIVPLCVIAAFFSVIGVPLGILLTIGYIILILMGATITAVVLANWINSGYAKKWKMWRLVWTALAIFVILKLISLTPVVGWLVMLLAVCLAFGAIITSIRWQKQQAGVS
jgi:cytoskeletal protein CcmA (bactofilin family)